MHLSEAEYFGRREYCPLYLCQLFLTFACMIFSLDEGGAVEVVKADF
jgi:hypothetical protein